MSDLPQRGQVIGKLRESPFHTISLITSDLFAICRYLFLTMFYGYTIIRSFADVLRV